MNGTINDSIFDFINTPLGGYYMKYSTVMLYLNCVNAHDR